MPHQLSAVEPANREQLLAELALVHQQATAFWDSLADDYFFAPHGAQWSPADNVRHLIKSSAPVALALRLPRFVPRLLFGGPAAPSQSYVEVVRRYRAALDAGGQAGRFAPQPLGPPADPAPARAKFMAQWRRGWERLMKAAQGWDNAALDGVCLPHPLIGKLTVREMLLFTLYHQRRHTQNVIDRRPV